MTREDAVETLLREKPFKICPACDGRGFAGRMSHDWADVDSCSTCLPESDTQTGSGKVWNEEWKEACLFLGLELPAARWRAADMGESVKL